MPEHFRSIGWLVALLALVAAVVLVLTGRLDMTTGSLIALVAFSRLV